MGVHVLLGVGVETGVALQLNCVYILLQSGDIFVKGLPHFSNIKQRHWDVVKSDSSVTKQAVTRHVTTAY
jgi:hypothetical protein